MKTWLYNEQGPEGINHIIETTDKEILQTYYSWWKEQMTKLGKQAQISEEACIGDWAVVNWAWEKLGDV